MREVLTDLEADDDRHDRDRGHESGQKEDLHDVAIAQRVDRERHLVDPDGQRAAKATCAHWESTNTATSAQ